MGLRQLRRKSVEAKAPGFLPGAKPGDIVLIPGKTKILRIGASFSMRQPSYFLRKVTEIWF